MSHNNSNTNTTSSNKRPRINEPTNIEELNKLAADYIFYIGANVNIKQEKIRENISKLNGNKLWERLDLLFRKWLADLDGDLDKDEDNNVNDQDIIDLMTRNGAKKFKPWFIIIRANARAIAEQYAVDNKFYDQSHEDSRNEKRERKRKRNRSKNCNMNIDENSMHSDTDSENDYLLDLIPDQDDTNTDVWQQLRRSKHLRIRRKQFKSSQEDVVSLIIVRAYNIAGMNQPLMLNYLKTFCKNVNFKISDLANASQLDYNNKSLPFYMLRRYFEYFEEECKNDEQKQALTIIASSVFRLFCSDYILEIPPHVINSSIVAIINADIKPPAFEEEFKSRLEAAIKANKCISWPYLAKDIACPERIRLGVCTKYKDCKFAHVCGECGYPHKDSDCRKIDMTYQGKKCIIIIHNLIGE
eukprot:435634_1